MGMYTVEPMSILDTMRGIVIKGDAYFRGFQGPFLHKFIHLIPSHLYLKDLTVLTVHFLADEETSDICTPPS